MKIKYTILLNLILLLFERCDPYDMKLKIVNNTNEIIYLDISKSKTFNSHPIFLTENAKDTVWNYMTWIKPKDSLMVPAIGNSWEGVVNKECVDSTLIIFIFKDHLLKTTSRDSVLKYQVNSKRLFLTVPDLNRINWRIDFR